MCIAIPGRVVEIVDPIRGLATVDMGGVQRTVDLQLLDRDDRPRPGDYVTVHLGLALSRLDAEEAQETLRMLEESR